MTEFVFHPPDLWGFKPFFTLQPVRATREKQLQIWRDMIVKYHKQINQFIMIPYDFPYFENAAIERKLSSEAIHAIVNYMIETGYAEWDDSEHTRLVIMWKKPEVLAGDIYEWAQKHYYIDSVFTIYELLSGDEYQDSGFFGIDGMLFRKALETLERANKCVIFQGSSSNEDGVKFLASTNR
mmetsp:Transcript_35112/g.35747  ORF Transcript_35112/g.35747 Transcript_35112/m.35747 type:complete len:182 (-) Transcript_35112:120-665(-)